tara:strand:- start:126 stop:524 length:399 start_codon:yes stop_codon:yes gene_type:complete
MAYTVGKKDGSQAFGFTDGLGTATPTGGGTFVVESYSESASANRVDLDDGNAKPIGSVTVPQRTEVTLGVQLGTNTASECPVIGDVLPYDGNNIAVTGVEVVETQADFIRLTINGFVMIQSSLTALDDINIS